MFENKSDKPVGWMGNGSGTEIGYSLQVRSSGGVEILEPLVEDNGHVYAVGTEWKHLPIRFLPPEWSGLGVAPVGLIGKFPAADGYVSYECALALVASLMARFKYRKMIELRIVEHHYQYTFMHTAKYGRLQSWLDMPKFEEYVELEKKEAGIILPKGM